MGKGCWIHRLLRLHRFPEGKQAGQPHPTYDPRTRPPQHASPQSNPCNRQSVDYTSLSEAKSVDDPSPEKSWQSPDHQSRSPYSCVIGSICVRGIAGVVSLRNEAGR